MNKLVTIKKLLKNSNREITNIQNLELTVNELIFLYNINENIRRNVDITELNDIIKKLKDLKP